MKNRYVVLVGFLFGVGLALGEDVGQVEMLRLIADGMESNIERIQTWKGSAECHFFSDTKTATEASIYDANELIHFVLDQNLNSIRCQRNIIKGMQERGSAIRTVDGDCGMFIVKDKIGYSMSEYMDGAKYAAEPRFMFIRPHKDIPQTLCGWAAFNPRVIIVEELWEKGRLPKRLSYLYSNPSARSSCNIAINRDGEKVFIGMSTQDTYMGKFGNITDSYVFDMAKSCNIIEYKHVDAIMKKNWRVDYAKFKDIFVPISIEYSYEYTSADPGGVKLIEKAQVALKTEMLNEPVDAGEFAIEKMPIRAGDQVIDHMQGGIQYEWKDTAANKIP